MGVDDDVRAVAGGGAHGRGGRALRLDVRGLGVLLHKLKCVTRGNY